MVENQEQLIAKINQLRKDRKVVILGHNYQRLEIQNLADFCGDSLELSRKAAATEAELIIFCGVHFMAESAAILSPDKTVILPRKDAGCPMADMATPEAVRKMKKEFPTAAVVSYVNTSAAVKAESDICCTSANAFKVVESLSAKEIIFLPDKNLAHYVSRFTQKKIIPWPGWCFVHNDLRVKEVQEAKEAYPEAIVLAHPECKPDVVDLADEVLSTSGMIRYVKAFSGKELIICTEEGLVKRLQTDYPDIKFILPSPFLVCRNMKLTRLEDVALALENMEPVIKVPEDISKKAYQALERMIHIA